MLHMTLRYWNIGYVFIVWQSVFKKCFLESKILPSINRYPIYKEKKTFWKETTTKKKKKEKKIFNGEKSINGLSKRIVALS